ncbi:MAG: response regulator [Chloroflexi bacterium]|nr:response regulator [Chloroflexota bacterium]MCZ6866742.1 response regulator [Chloroflexota bacterium]
MEVLLVEDNPGDVRLVEEAILEGGLWMDICVVGDGVEAMAFLRKQGSYTDVPSPDLVLLDLNLPGKDGREVLAEVKEDPILRSIPVVVLTSSNHERDVQRAKELHADGYIIKPGSLDQLIAVMRSLENSWSRTVKVPQE